MRPRSTYIALLFLLLTLGACASGAHRGAVPAQEQTTLRVQNQSWLDMNVFVLRSGQRIRLGMVPGSSTRVLVIPANIMFGMTPLQFMADPVGSPRTPISQEITVRPGDEVTLIIPNR